MDNRQRRPVQILLTDCVSCLNSEYPPQPGTVLPWIVFRPMERNCDILLFGSMGDIGQTLEAGLARHGLAVTSVPFPQNTFRDFSGYRRELMKCLESVKPAMILPVGDALALSMIKPELPAGITVPVDVPGNIRLLSSKTATYALARELGIRQPELCGAAVLAAGRRVIFKRDRSFGGSGVHKPKSPDALANLIAHENGTPYLIEEYIEGTDLSVDCIIADGYFRAGCYISLGREYTQGPSAERSPADCPEAVQTAFTLLSHLKFRGVCGLDFRQTENGRLFFLECNPRFTGGLATQIGAGFDIPYLLYRLWSTE